MNDYLFIYEGGDPDWLANTSPEEMQAVMQRWNDWFKELESAGNLRNPGAALLPGGSVVRRSGDGFATDTSMAEVKELIGGYSVIAAESIEQATELAQGSPHLDDPGSRVIVRGVMSPDAP